LVDRRSGNEEEEWGIQNCYDRRWLGYTRNEVSGQAHHGFTISFSIAIQDCLLYGMEEYYLYGPDTEDLSGWLRVDGTFDVIDPIDNWVSPD
jgi:hypothetical protein